jgi:hypothetical protein
VRRFRGMTRRLKPTYLSVQANAVFVVDGDAFPALVGRRR